MFLSTIHTIVPVGQSHYRGNRADAGLLGERAGALANRAEHCFHLAFCALIICRAFSARAHLGYLFELVHCGFHRAENIAYKFI